MASVEQVRTSSFRCRPRGRAIGIDSIAHDSYHLNPPSNNRTPPLFFSSTYLQELYNIFSFYTLHGNPLDPEHIRVRCAAPFPAVSTAASPTLTSPSLLLRSARNL